MKFGRVIMSSSLDSLLRPFEHKSLKLSLIHI